MARWLAAWMMALAFLPASARAEVPLPARCPAVLEAEDGARCFTVALRDADLFLARLPGGAGAPLLLLPGGPGMAPSDDPRRWLERLQPWRRDRPVLLLDLRGTGRSRPALDCPEISTIDPLAPAALAACRQRLSGAGIPLSFGSRQLAADIIALRRALGVESWVLLGISHGTRLALLVARADPAGTAALVLDGLRPPWQALYGDGLPAGRARVAAELVAECRAQTGCTADYPDLAANLSALADTRHAGMLAFMVSDPAIRPLVPQWTRRLLRGETPPSAGQPAGIAIGHHLSLVCAEDDGPAMPSPYRAACAAWAVPAIPPETDFQLAGPPALVLEGRWDALTPLDRTGMAAHLPQARLLRVADAGHDVLAGSDCARRAVRRFLADPSTRAPVADCPDRPDPQRFLPPDRADRALPPKPPAT